MAFTEGSQNSSCSFESPSVLSIYQDSAVESAETGCLLGAYLDTPPLVTPGYLRRAPQTVGMLAYAIALLVALGFVYGTVRLLRGDDIPNVIG